MVQHASGADGEDTPSIKSPRSHSLHSAADSCVLRSAYTGVTNCAERFSPRISKKRKGRLSSSAVSSALSPGSECLFWAAPSTWRRVRPACPLAGSFSALAGGLCGVAWHGVVWWRVCAHCGWFTCGPGEPAPALCVCTALPKMYCSPSRFQQNI